MIDWFTVGAQAVNFLLLVGLMKHFLYRPILAAVDAREARTAATLAAAAETAKAAEADRSDLHRKNQAFDAEQATRQRDAAEEAARTKERLLAEARDAADALAETRRSDLAEEERQLRDELARRTRAGVFTLARAALAALADTTLEAAIVAAFCRRVQALEGDAKAALAASIESLSGPALVRSAFDLPAEQRSAVQAALANTFSAEVSLRWETDPDLLGGIEFTAGGQKVAWSLAARLADVQQGAEHAAEAQAA